MSVREYIGARYVPIFLGQWNSELNYEPLSVVIEQGNSYTSRKEVPAGIPVSNEEYWAQSGNYNAQLEAYRNEVFSFNERIENNETNIAEEIETREKQYVELKNYTLADTLYGHILTRDARDVSYLYSDPMPPTWNGVQGCCWTKEGRFAALFSPGIEYYRTHETQYLNTCIIREFLPNGKEYRKSLPILCGHGNQLTYNAVKNEFVIADNYYLEGDLDATRHASPSITRVNYENLHFIENRSYTQLGNTINGVSYDSKSNTLMVFNSDEWKAAYIDPYTYELLNGEIIDLSVFNQIYEDSRIQFDASRRQTQCHNDEFIIMGFYMPNLWAFVRREDPTKIIKVMHCNDYHDGEVEGFDIDNDGNFVFAMHKRYYQRHTNSVTNLIDQEFCSNIYTIYGSNVFTNSWDSDWVEGSAVLSQRWVDVNPNTDNVIQNGSVTCPCKTIMEAYWIASTRESNVPIDIRIQSGASGVVGPVRLVNYYGRLQDYSNGNVVWSNNFRLAFSKCDMLNINWVEITDNKSMVPYPFSSYSDVSINSSTVTLSNCAKESTLRDVFIDESVAIINNDGEEIGFRKYRNSIISTSGGIQ